MFSPERFPRAFAISAMLAACALCCQNVLGPASASSIHLAALALPSAGQAKSPQQVAGAPQAGDGGARATHFALDPDPVQVCEGGAAVTVRWEVAGVSSVEVHVGAPDGPLFARSGSGASAKATGDWVREGTTFYLQNTSGRLPLAAENTLAKVRARVSSSGCGKGDATPGRDARPAEARPTPAEPVRGTASLRGSVADQAGSVLVGAAVTLTGPDGVKRSAETNLEGDYSFNALPAGAYVLEAGAQGFAGYKKANLNVAGGRRNVHNVKLEVTLREESVTVNSEKPLSTEPGRNLTSLVLRGQALKALPSNPRAMVAALRALSQPAAGPNAAPIYVDGFTGGRIPPKDSIREVRINENPFAAEYDKLGFGVIEVFTKPGAEEFKFGTSFTFNDESLNTRDPFAPERAPSQSRQFGATVSGPALSKRASFFFDFQRQGADSNSVVNATVLDDALGLAPFVRSVPTPGRELQVSPRFDLQLNPNNTLVARYYYTGRRAEGVGVGDFTLPSAGYNTRDSEQTVQLTETAVLGPNALNEARFQFRRSRRMQEGDNSAPSVEVLDAFVGGGSSLGRSFADEDAWEAKNHLFLTRGAHALKLGGYFRRVSLADSSDRDFNGTFVFAGSDGPLLDAAGNTVVLGRRAVLVPLTGIERYRRTLFFRQRGFSPADISNLGGGPSQFRIAEGERLARVSQLNYAGFAQDDWRLRPNFTLSAGLRYEWQTNIRDRTNFAPRLSFAWAPGAGSADPKTVVRGGYGLFYERVGEDLSLQARRYGSTGRREFLVAEWDAAIPFPDLPSRAELEEFKDSPTVYRFAPDLRAPYSLQSSLSLERQLPFSFTSAATFTHTRTLHLLRMRNVNAPVPGTFEPGFPEDGGRPFGDVGQIYQFESSGVFRQRQLSLNLARNGKLFTFYVTYVLNKAMSDTDGSDSFPADSYDLRSEYGRSSLDVRQSVYVGGWFTAPFGIEVYPLVFARTGVPFNITTGEDLNGDTLFTERPAFATDLSRASVRRTAFGDFDLDPQPGQTIIPRNYGRGPGFFSVNLTLSKSFTFREGGSGDVGSAAKKRPFSMTLTMQIENLLNRTNPDAPVGNLNSPLFGLSQSSVGPFGTGTVGSGNRRVELQVSFNF